jgi:diphthamide biosynthesis protein 2
MYQTTTIGILVHNVGLRSSHAVVKDLRKLIREKGRKSYTISVGRVRPEKLANFESIGGWVLVGCKEGGLIDGKEYYRPIVTPHELRLALQGEMESWKPDEWTLDLDSVLRDIKRDRLNAEMDEKDGVEDEDDDRPIFSLADGSYHMTRRYGGKEDEQEQEQEKIESGSSGALIKRTEGGALIKRNEVGRVAGGYSWLIYRLTRSAVELICSLLPLLTFSCTPGDSIV